MKTTFALILCPLLAMAAPARLGAEGLDGNKSASRDHALSDGAPLSAKVVENVYLMPEQITKLIFPKAIEEVSVNTQIINITRNPAGSRENYLLLSPKSARGDVNMHVVLDGATYTFRLIVGQEMVNYRKTYTLRGRNPRNLPKIPALAPSEINTTQLVRIINQAMKDPNYAGVVAKDLESSPQGRNYLWNGAQVTLQDAWHYFPQDVIILRIEVYNPTSEAIYLSASQIEPYIANTRFGYLLTQQGAKLLLPGQTDIKYLFLQGYGIDLEEAAFELRLPATREQLKSP
jgi:hypothetical protein